MAQIDNAQAIRFANEEARVAADALLRAYRTAKVLVQDYYGKSGLSQTFVTGIADTIQDGADSDGRSIITGNEVLNLITFASNFIADLEASNNTKLNVLLGVAVNGQSRI